MVDVSQEFVQSANVAHHERYLIRPPELVILPWKRELAWKLPRNPGKDTYFFLMTNHLYGLREIPLRRLTHLAETLRRGGLRHGRIDICTFRLTEPMGGEIIRRLLTYVDDILIAYRRDGLEKCLDTISEYKIGEAEKLHIGSTLQFLGLDLVRVGSSEIQFPQHSFISRLKMVGPNDYVCNGKTLTTAEKTKTFYKSPIGAFIWTNQTRFDTSYLIAAFATSAACHVSSASQAVSTIALINKIIRGIQNRPAHVSFISFWKANTHVTGAMMRTLKLVAFPEAGFACLMYERSIESGVIMLGCELKRAMQYFAQGGGGSNREENWKMRPERRRV